MIDFLTQFNFFFKVFLSKKGLVCSLKCPAVVNSLQKDDSFEHFDTVYSQSHFFYI
jgi:hypothetical protein